MIRYDVEGGWVMGLCKKPAWGRKFPPLAPPGSAPKIEEFQKVENKPAARLQIKQLLLELYSVVKKKAQGFH